MRRGKGIVLISGGLDSLLAARVLMDQDIDLIGFHGVLPFEAPDIELSELRPVQLAADMNLQVHAHRCGREYIDMLRNPAHGYGKHMNPCIDCHIYFINKAAELMRELQADFVATGEVVGQRPMSQMRHTMNHIEKVTGLGGRLLRPLSAKLLKPTIPEEEGIINRDLLLGINGRSRAVQFELARKYGIEKFASPSGGCLFTDTFISKRVRDLFKYQSNPEAYDLYLLTIGRHFRISSAAKIIVSRNERENNEMEKYRSQSDYFFVPEFKGPAIIAKGLLADSEMELIGSVMVRYGKINDGMPVMSIYSGDSKVSQIDVADPISDALLEKMRI